MKIHSLASNVSRAISMIAVYFLLLASAAAQSSKPLRSLAMADARVGPGDTAQGDMWTGWSPDHKLGLVQGLLEGSYWGYFQACTEAYLAAGSVPKVKEKCMEHIPAAHLTSEQYVSLITEFYTKYPEDRALPMRRLLMKLLEPGMSVDGVHKWLDELIESVRGSQDK